MTIVGASINWNDRFANFPNLMVLLDGPVEFGEAWNASEIKGETETLYWRESGGLYSYFVWSGTPDRGFGGWRRTIKLVDDSERFIVGGWASNPSTFPPAGLPPVLEVSVYHDKGDGGASVGPVSLAIEQDLARLVVRAFCPGVEIIETSTDYTPLSFKFEGEMSKPEWQDLEDARITPIREALSAKYGRYAWYNSCSEEERESIKAKPYSGIGGREPQRPIDEQFWAQEALR